MMNTPIPSTDEAGGSGVHIYRPTVPGLEPTTTGRLYTGNQVHCPT